jgi:CHAT domain-containing protein/Tfp pilus assembly protein PilF
MACALASALALTVFVDGSAMVHAAASDSAAISAIRGRMQEGNYAAAESLARLFSKPGRSPSRPDSIARADRLDLLVEARWRGGKSKSEETRRLSRDALRLRERLHGRDHLDIGLALNNLAIVHYIDANLAAAESLWTRMLQIREKALGPNHLLVARVLNNLAELHRTAGRYARARELLERTIDIKVQALGRDDRDVLLSQSNLAVLYGAMGEFSESRDLLEKVLEAQKRTMPAPLPDIAYTQSTLGEIYRNLGEYSIARRHLEESLAIRRQVLGDRHPSIGENLNRIGICLYMLGDYLEAIPMFEQALTLYHDVMGPDHIEAAHVMNNLALLHDHIGAPELALPLYERSLRIQEKVYGPDHFNVAQLRVNLGRVAMASSDFDRAREFFIQGRTDLERSVGPRHPEVASGLFDHGKLMMLTGDAAAAESLFASAQGIYEASYGTTHPDLAHATSWRAFALAQLGDSSASLRAALHAEQIGRDHVRLALRMLPERQALNYVANRPTGLDIAIRLVRSGLERSRHRDVVDAVIRSRALVLDEMAGRRHMADAGADSTAHPWVQRATLAGQRLANLLVRGASAETQERFRASLETARREYEAAERELAERSVEHRRRQSQDRIGLAEVQAALPRNAALVAYFRDEPRRIGGQELRGAATHLNRPTYVAFIVRHDAEPIALTIGPAREIDSLVIAWRAAVQRGPSIHGRSDDDAFSRTIGHALRQRIWDPIATVLQGMEQAFLVPDGQLHLVSFDGLPVGQSQFRIEHAPHLHYLSAERELARRVEGPPGTRGVLAIGGPSYDAWPTNDDVAVAETHASSAASAPHFRGARSDCRDFSEMRFRYLPGTAAEAQQVVRLSKRYARKGGRDGASESLYLGGAQANETALRSSAVGRSVLHLATHGFFVGAACADSGSGSGTAATAGASTSGRNVNPLWLSGLALSGANRRDQAGQDQDDGILTAEEVASMDLGGVQWAVLSACETGLGELRLGEGVLGLRRAFEIAGVRSLIMSLWSVDDEATRTWMRHLYEGRWNRRRSTSEAVREAGLQVLRERRQRGESTHPLYWAAFVATGDWK